MTIAWEHWRIKSYEYGYKVQRKLNNDRWISQTYHTNLRQAVLELFQYRTRSETVDITVDAIDEASARAGRARLLKRIEAIAAEIQQGLPL